MPNQYFRLLDGLRGLAAIAVVVYHFSARSDLGELLPHGYNAVDFFFVLSGLVVGHAYGQRLRDQMTASQYLRLRWIRLWPMIVPGTLFAAAIEFWRPTTAASHIADVVRSAILGSVPLPWPFPTSLEQTIFPLNGPVWSLFFELFASFAFVVVGRRAWKPWALPILIVAGVFGVCWSIATTGSVDAGPYVGNWIGGFARVSCSFFIGVALVSARRRIPAVRAWVYAVALIVIFLCPVGDGATNKLFEAVIVFAIFPLIVASASHCEVSPSLARLCDRSGEISYPLYALHYPIVRVICFVMNRHAIPPIGQAVICVATVAVTCGISLVASRLYDRPFRRYLTRRFATGSAGAVKTARPAFAQTFEIPLHFDKATEQ